MNREHYEQAFNPDGDYASQSIKVQYQQAWHLRRYAETRRNKFKNIMNLYYFMCAEYGIRYKIAHMAAVHFAVKNWPEYPSFWQNKRLARIQELERIAAYDIISLAHFW